jgi:hypothetical protein
MRKVAGHLFGYMGPNLAIAWWSRRQGNPTQEEVCLAGSAAAAIDLRAGRVGKGLHRPQVDPCVAGDQLHR